MLFTNQYLNAQTFTYNCLQEDCGGLCYTFTSPFQGGTTNNWNFGDGSTITTTDVTVTHCYTNVDTYNSINTSANVTLTVTGQQQQGTTLNHSNCQHGVFIGAVDGTTSTYLTSYSVMPGSSFDGSNNTMDVYVYAPIIIDKSFEFQDTDIFMRPTAGFNHIRPYAFSLNGTSAGVTQSCDCQWRGILVSSGVFYSSNNTTIKDATFGIVYRGGFLLDIQQTNFVNNYIGLLALNVPSGLYLNLNFSGNTISSSGPLLDYCEGGIFENPFKFSQNVFDNSRTFAGIYLEGVNTSYIGTNSGSLNTFSEIANGIVLKNSTVGIMASPNNITGGIANCRFLKIQRGSYPASIGGYGVQVLASEQGHFVRQEGTGQNNTTIPSFDMCEVGIACSYPKNGGNTKIISFNNRMLNMETGYRLISPVGTIRADIHSNYISSDQDFGNASSLGSIVADCISIFFGSQTTATDIKVSDNILSLDQDLGVVAGIRVTKNYLDVSTAGTIDINGNEVTVIDKGWAIVAVSPGGAMIRENTLTVGDYLSSDGIWLAGGNELNVLCNDIFGPQPVDPSMIAPTQDGISAFWTANPVIRDNHITDFDHALKVEYDCGTADIGCNDFLGDNAYGLFHSSNAIAGPQLDKGNVWDCTSASGFEAYSGALLLVPTDIFSVDFDDTSTPSPFPDTYFPSMAPNEFFVDLGNPTPTCPIDPACELTVVVAEVTSTDNAIAKGELTEFPGIVNSAKQNLYRKLVENPDLLTGDSLMQAFVSSMEDSTVGKFYTLRSRIPELATISSATQADIDNNLEQIQDNLAEMDSLAALIATQTSWTTYDARQQRCDELAQDIIQLYEANDSIFEELQADRLALADSLLDFVDGINAVEIFEINEQKVFDIFLNTIGKGDTIATTAQLDTLESIAAQCPEEGGRAVLEAIVLHRALAGSNLQLTDCSTEERAAENPMPAYIARFGLYPNPTGGVCNAHYQLEKDQTGELSVWDAFGKQVSHYVLDSESRFIQLNNLPSGIFFVRLSVNGRILQTEKLVKF
jgi:hypothetical protein